MRKSVVELKENSEDLKWISVDIQVDIPIEDKNL
jgi:hypothetical protein